MPLLFGPQAGEASLGWSLAITAVKVVLLVGFTFVVGQRVIPWLLDRIADTRSRELFTLTVLAIALGIAVGSAVVFGVSMALGAFLAGMVVGRSDYSLRAASDALPMRDAFAVLFFVSVGMLLDPGALLAAPGLVAASLGIVLVGKPVSALAVVLLLRYPRRVALAVAVALAQIGEFSFILATLGRELSLLPGTASNTIVAVAIISIVANPLLYRGIVPLDRWLSARGWTGQAEPSSPAPREGGHVDGHRAIVVGYGPTGRTLSRLLAESGISPTIIELNMETVRTLREQGIQAIYGDASQRDTLEAAGARSVANLIIAADVPNAPEVIEIARELNERVFGTSTHGQPPGRRRPQARGRPGRLLWRRRGGPGLVGGDAAPPGCDPRPGRSRAGTRAPRTARLTPDGVESARGPRTRGRGEAHP